MPYAASPHWGAGPTAVARSGSWRPRRSSSSPSMASTRSRPRRRKPRTRDRDLAIGIVGSMILCVDHLHGGRGGRDRRARLHRGFANSAEPLALDPCARSARPAGAAKMLGVSAVSRLADRDPRLLLRSEPDFLHHGARRPAADRPRPVCRRRGTPVRITFFTARRRCGDRRLVPAGRDRRAGQCGHADGLHRRLRRDAGPCAAAEPDAPRTFHDPAAPGWSASARSSAALFVLQPAARDADLLPDLEQCRADRFIWSIAAGMRGERPGGPRPMPRLPPVAARRLKNIVGGSAGNLVEVVRLVRLFRPSRSISRRSSSPRADQTAQLLQTAAIFAVGFIMRPIGAWPMGIYADHSGRKAGLTLSRQPDVHRAR